MLEVNFPVFPLLETKRCLLRRVDKNDAASLFFLRSNEEVMRYVDRENFTSEKEAEEMIEKINAFYEKGDGFSLTVCLKGTDTMIGLAGLWRMDKENHRAEIGYSLHPDHWNKGIMSEVVAEIIRFGFKEIGLHSIEANVNPANLASIRLLEKAGFVREAYFKENYFFRGKYLDSAIYSLLNH